MADASATSPPMNRSKKPAAGPKPGRRPGRGCYHEVSSPVFIAPADSRRCPICLEQIPKGELSAHHQLELRRLADGNPEPTDEAGSVKPRRGAAVAAAQQIAQAKKGKGPARSGIGLVDANEQDEAHYSISSSEPLPTDPESVNAHIDRCLARQGVGASADADDLVMDDDEEEEVNDRKWGAEYTFDGVTRVRASALVEGYAESSGFSIHRRTDHDIDDDIDIDEDDTEQFGEVQYGEDTIVRLADDDGDEGGRALGSAQTIPPPHPPQDDDGVDIETDLPDSVDLKGIAGNSRLIIESLKTRVRDLLLASNPGLKTPLPAMSKDHGSS
ncbi:hypothetical protein BDK51DRAFT_31571 [Blyttiomyces helicus]|uniref:E3 ubiquitin-protein ligase RNF220 middle domain-containing protein n=1 Tax=Blyttiomyces helicus TaxID=388810 RepID=A0A4P9WJ40_9FUNG|nr:hypothetical protein BDK51DRAFT_31571 [Blyttiomyces helicus]|eukprot:RKO92065.1 hypothetical protein BDK51DRAFT_31571 [Blyttiomyces helicus]